MDIAAYLARIGYQGPAQADPGPLRSSPPKPTLDTLHGLVAAHNRSIPFENLDPLMGIPVHDLGAEALTAKLVAAPPRRLLLREQRCHGLRAGGRWDTGWTGWPGGWCGCSRRAHRSPGRPTTCWRSTVPGEDGRFLVDVGFGGQTLSSPIRLQAGPVQQTRHEPYRLGRAPRGSATAGPGARRMAAALPVQPAHRSRWIDLSIGSWYSSTYPTAVFVVGLSVALVTDDARWNLRGRNLAIHADGSTETDPARTSAADVLDQLVNRFGIDVSDGCGRRRGPGQPGAGQSYGS